MYLSSIEIMNAALVHVGSEPILTEDDDSTRGRVVKAAYLPLLMSVTRGHPWRHATAYAKLARLDPKPDNVFDFSSVFQLPEDCLRVFSTNLDTMDRWTEIEGKRIACDRIDLTVKFIRLVEDVSKWSANFTQAMIWSLAENISLALSASTERAQLCGAKAKTELELARSFDAQVGQLDRVVADDFLRSRYY